MANLFDDAEVIHHYTRKQALEDGVLVDLSELAGEAGIKFPLAVTQGVFEVLNDTRSPGQDFTGRAWDMLMIFRMEARKTKGAEIRFAPLFVMEKGKCPVPVPMWAKCGPGDEMEPVITVMMPDED